MPRPYRVRSDAEWAELIRECKSSGLSDYQWCIENRIPQTSFYRHLRKFHGTTIKELPQAAKAELAIPAAQEIVPVRVVGDPEPVPEPSGSRRAPAARVTVNGITIDLFDNADPGLISGILSAASSLC